MMMMIIRREEEERGRTAPKIDEHVHNNMRDHDGISEIYCRLPPPLPPRLDSALSFPAPRLRASCSWLSQQTAPIPDRPRVVSASRLDGPNNGYVPCSPPSADSAQYRAEAVLGFSNVVLGPRIEPDAPGFFWRSRDSLDLPYLRSGQAQLLPATGQLLQRPPAAPAFHKRSPLRTASMHSSLLHGGIRFPRRPPTAAAHLQRSPRHLPKRP